MLRCFSNLVALFACVNLVACASTTNIHSSDPNAKIYIDGEMMGRGNVSHTDTKIIGSVTSVRLQKEGCEPQNFTFARSEQFDVGACIGGVFVLVPFLWIEGYKPEHSYEYECIPTEKAEKAERSEKSEKSRSTKHHSDDD